MLGVVPHVVHHIGLVAGAALLTGAAGNGFLYVVGLLLSLPLLRRLKTRDGSGVAPVIGGVVFTALSALSAFVIGPAIGRAPVSVPAVAPSVTTDHHRGHH